MMFWFSPMLTMISIGLGTLPFAATMIIGSRAANAEKTVSERNQVFLDALKDNLTGFSVIKSFRAEKEMCRLFTQNVKALAGAKCRRQKIGILVQLLGSVAGITSQFGVFFAGVWLALNGKGVSTGVVITFVQLMNYIIGPIQSVPRHLANRKAANALIDRLADALSANVRDEGDQIPQILKDGIEIKDLSFSYDGEKTVLEQISIKFEAGRSYAIVGTSGSGKSTLLNLLMAGHSQYDGSICYDGKELRSISSESLYDLVSMIQQNVFVFNSSIRDNVTMFHRFDDAAVAQALSLSGLDEFIRQRGADALCGENGCGLSGGEKQRISIARSLLRKSPILLMDEATAALDVQTAYRVISSILDLKGLTRIVVTHALDEHLLKQYDSIIALKSGKIVESGSFEELMRQKGYFYSLYTVSQ